MAVVGDSLAYGTGAGSTQAGFAYRVFAAIEKTHPGSTYVNFAVPGSRVADVTAFQSRRLRETNPNLVLVVAGANDLLQTRDASQFAEKYARMIDTLRSSAPHATIVAAGMPDVSRTLHVPEFAKPATSALCASLNAEMRRIAAQRGAHFLDLYTLTNAGEPSHRQYLSSDGFHPSAAGYAEIAKAVYPVIEAAISP